MKRLITLLLFLAFAIPSSSQTVYSKKTGFYGDIGYSIMIYTNSLTNSIYPAFNFRVSSFNSEITLDLGYKVSDIVSVEFAPSFIYSRSGGSNGFYYTTPGTSSRNYYVPSPPYLFAIPLNAKVKLYPFTKSSSIFTKGLFFGIAGGPMMIHEEYDNYIYPDDSQNNLINIRSYNNTMWTGNLQLTFGYRGGDQFTYGFEAGYRFVPIPVNRVYPMVSNIASDMNSVILNLKVGFNF